jgi:hypothetical protein
MHVKGILGRLGLTALALATVAGGLVFAGSTAQAQSPSSVPAARFYGTARCPQGACPSNLTITAFVGSTTCTGTQSIPQSQTNSGIDNGGNYVIDIQSVPGCTTPGGTVTFTAGSYRARETGTVPDIPGTAVHLNLTFQLPATPTAAPTQPPATPTRAPTTAPPPPTPPPATATRPPAPSPTVQRPVTQQAPKGPVAAQAPKSAPVAAAPATAPRLPNTGTGGLLDQQSSNSLTGWALALIVLAALGVSASGIFAYRRSR